MSSKNNIEMPRAVLYVVDHRYRQCDARIQMICSLCNRADVVTSTSMPEISDFLLLQDSNRILFFAKIV
jgi:hypothetical protein